LPRKEEMHRRTEEQRGGIFCSCFCACVFVLLFIHLFFLTYKLDVVAIVINDIAAAPARITTSTTAEATVIKALRANASEAPSLFFYLALIVHRVTLPYWYTEVHSCTCVLFLNFQFIEEKQGGKNLFLLLPI
jgi:hypothetical protein